MLPKNTALFRSLAPRYMGRLISDFSFTDLDAAAVMGNAGVESAGFALMQEVSPRAGRGGLGAFQWTGPRRVQFELWLRRKGARPNDFEASYAFLFRELIGPERAAVAATKRAPNLFEKTKAFERAFERAGVPAWDKRTEWAQLALDTWRALPTAKRAELTGAVVAKLPPPPDIPAPKPPCAKPVSVPAPPSSKPAPSGGFFAALGALLRAAFPKG